MTDDGGPAISGGTPSQSADAAFEAALVALYPELLRVAILMAHREADAEDALQTALARAWRARHQLHNPTRLRAWLTRIMVREIVRRQTSPWARLVRTSPTIIDISPAVAAQPDHALTMAVIEALTQLSPPQRAVVVLHHYAGYPIVEVAAIVDAPVETVRSRLRLAMVRLRSELAE